MSTTNLLVALKNIVENPVPDVFTYYASSNRINNVGEALELYIKDVFCNSITQVDLTKKMQIHSEEFSYIGNQNNPPDMIIRGGDAIEVKKIQSKNSEIALNSSYPKDKLYANSVMLTDACRTCEVWTEKDLLYVVGVVKSDILESLWFVYGDCYAASSDIYEGIKNKISKGVYELENVEFVETNEIARVNRVDPLGITFLRVRGMWQIENPNKVFSYLVQGDGNTNFSVNALLLKNKYELFPDEDRTQIENMQNENFSITDIKIKSPNNPANLLEAKLISFTQ
jgi:hypothetical protein